MEEFIKDKKLTIDNICDSVLSVWEKIQSLHYGQIYKSSRFSDTEVSITLDLPKSKELKPVTSFSQFAKVLEEDEREKCVRAYWICKTNSDSESLNHAAMLIIRNIINYNVPLYWKDLNKAVTITEMEMRHKEVTTKKKVNIRYSLEDNVNIMLGDDEGYRSVLALKLEGHGDQWYIIDTTSARYDQPPYHKYTCMMPESEYWKNTFKTVKDTNTTEYKKRLLNDMSDVTVVVRAGLDDIFKVLDDPRPPQPTFKLPEQQNFTSIMNDHVQARIKAMEEKFSGPGYIHSVKFTTDGNISHSSGPGFGPFTNFGHGHSHGHGHGHSHGFGDDSDEDDDDDDTDEEVLDYLNKFGGRQAFNTRGHHHSHDSDDDDDGHYYKPPPPSNRKKQDTSNDWLDGTSAKQKKGGGGGGRGGKGGKKKGKK